MFEGFGGRRMMQDNQQLTVILADDHNIVREGIAALCTANGMRVLGQASDGGGAIEMIESLLPDFAILDLHMPGFTGVEAIRRLRAQNCKTKLMILSISREETAVMEALRAGRMRIYSRTALPGTCWTPSASCATAASTCRRCCAAPDCSPRPKKAGASRIRWHRSARARWK